MTAILAIDAAWTKTEPSGVALVTSNSTGWRCVAVHPSYATFLDLASDLFPGASFASLDLPSAVGPHG